MTPEVTVAVPVKDRREQMLRCVDALLAQDHPSFEILVLDNESTDGTPDAVLERAASSGGVDVRVEVVPGPVGRVRNQAAVLARGEFLAFTDSDCLPEPGWLSAAVAALRADASLGVVQGRTLPEVEVEHGWAATIRVEELSGLYEACNLVFRRVAFAESDGFDEEVGHFWEDTAAGFAVRRNGWGVAFAHDAVVRHDVTYPGFWWHVKRMQKNRNLAPVLKKYPEIRSEVLFLRVFRSDRDARFIAFVVAALTARRRPLIALALSAPYLQLVMSSGPRTDPKLYAQAVVYDASRVVGFLRGALRHGVFVL